jgi:hypothetical protein
MSHLWQACASISGELCPTADLSPAPSQPLLSPRLRAPESNAGSVPGHTATLSLNSVPCAPGSLRAALWSLPAHESYRGAPRDALAADGLPSARLSDLCKLHVHGAGSLLPLLDLEGDTLSLSQRLECRAFDPRSMEEDLAAIICRDESKAALLHHPFDFPRCHDVALSPVRVTSCRLFPTCTVMHP